MNVGIVGLGAMGREVATVLLAAGHQVLAWNRSPGPVEALASEGATAAQSVAEVLQADVVLSLLFDADAVRTVFDDATLAAARPGLVHACMSTIPSAVAGELAAAHRHAGLHYVAAPMFGRPEAAAAAQLNIVLSGEADAVATVEPVLGALGRTWPMGTEPTAAHVAKLSGNFLISVAVEAMAEAAALLRHHDADPAPFLDMMGQTLFAAPIYKLYGGIIGSGTPPPRPSGIRVPYKDNGLILAEAGDAPLLPLARVVRERLGTAIEHGMIDDDWGTAAAATAMRMPPAR